MPMFVDTSPPGQCIFCRLVAGDIPSARVFEDELTLAFMDLARISSRTRRRSQEISTSTTASTAS